MAGLETLRDFPSDTREHSLEAGVDRLESSADDQRRQHARAERERAKFEMALRSVEAVEARIIRLEALLEMKRVANRLKDLVDLEALQKNAPNKK